MAVKKKCPYYIFLYSLQFLHSINVKDFEEGKWRVARGSLQDLVLAVEFVMTS